VLKNNKGVYLRLKKIICLGYQIETLKERKIFNDFLLSKEGKKFVEFSRKKNITSYNKALRATYDSLLFVALYP